MTTLPSSTYLVMRWMRCAHCWKCLTLTSDYPPPFEIHPGGGGGFDFSSDNRWLCCALLFFLCWRPLLALTPLHIQTQMYARHSCLVPLLQQGHHGVWGQGHMFHGKLYLAHDICKDEHIPMHSPLPPHLPILSLSLNCPLNMSRGLRFFGLEKRSFIQFLWKGHMHDGNIMFQ